MRPISSLCLLLAFGGLALPQRDSAAQEGKEAINLIQMGRTAEAVDLLQRTLTRHPENVNLWNLMGIADTEEGKFPLAKQAFERGLALLPESVELNENLGLLFFRQANYTGAKHSLSKAVTLGSNKPGVLFSLAAAKLRTGEPAQALTDLQSLEPALSSQTEYWEERGRAELLIEPRNAGMSFDRALALSSNNNVTLLNEAAAAAEKEGLDEKALAYLIQARRVVPEDVATLVHFGSVCIRRDLGPDARDALEKAHHLQPLNDTALYLLARANISLQNWQQAYDLFEQFSKRAPNYAPAHYAMGWLDIRLNRPSDARTQLRRALSLSPSLSGAAHELAQLELNDGQLDSAEKLLRAVIAHDSSDAKSNMLLGDILMRKGQLEQAKHFLSTAVQQDPSLAAAHYKLSILLFRMHEPQKAEQEKNIASTLTADAKKASKTQLRLVLPETENGHSK